MFRNLTDEFLTGPLSFEGTQYTNEEIENHIKIIKSELIEKFEAPSTIFLKDRNPLRFSLSYFLLLDNGHCPIPLAPDFNSYQLEEMTHVAHFSISENLVIVSKGESGVSYDRSYGALTSGTTSMPKLCYLSLENAKKNAISHALSFGINNEHTIIQSLPLSHSFGVVCYLWTKLVMGCALDFNSVFLGMKALSKREFNKGVLYASPAQLKFLLREKCEPIKGINIVSFGGGSASTADIVALSEKFYNTTKFYVSYGLTEAGPRVTSGLVDKIKDDGFIGSAMPGIELKILSETNELLSEGHGKLCIKTPSIKLNPLDDEVVSGEFLKTRDLVELKDGVVYFKSRDSDLIKVGGISVYPTDIERVAKEIEGVMDAIVFSKPHKMYGEIAILVIEGKVDAETISENIKNKLSVQQMPKKIFIEEEFPRHSLGKIDRQALKNKLEL